MDPRLLDWARAVKARRRSKLPPLWLFTDRRRLADPLAAARRLPPWLGGVVLRDDDAPDRRALGEDLAQLCRARHLGLVVAVDVRLAARLGAGLHIRNGRRPLASGQRRRRRALLTSSAHDLPSLRRAALAGVDLVFLSPVFATGSHPGVHPLGLLRWARLATRAGVPVAVLGGVNGKTLRGKPGWLPAAAGAIEAFSA